MGPVELFTTTVAITFDPIQPRPLAQESLQEFMRTPLTVSQGLDGSTVVTSNRDQVAVSLWNNKIDVRVIGDSVDAAATKVPQVLLSFLKILPELKIRSYGINFLFESSSDAGPVWLGETFLNQALRELGPGLSTDNVKFSFENHPKLQTVVLQIGGGAKLIVNTNASQQATDLPNGESLGSDISSQHEFMMTLLKGWGFA